MAKKHRKNVNVFLVCMVAYILITIIFICINIKNNNLVFVNIKEYPASEIQYSENIINVLSLNITIVTTLVGLSFALVVFLLDKNNIKLSDYLSLVAGKDNCLLIMFITFLNTVFSLFVIYHPHTIIIDIWLKIAIVPSVILFVVLIKNFGIVDKKEKMQEHLLYLLNRKDKIFTKFIMKITDNSFHEDFYEILDYVMKNTTNDDKNYLFSINQEIINTKKDKDIDYILKMQLFVLPGPDEPLFSELQNKYLDFAFKEYKKLLFGNNVTYNNFILRIKSSLYTNIIYNKNLNNDQEKELLTQYLYLMYRSYELVIIILGKNKINDARESINDFWGLVQLFTVNEMINQHEDISISERHDYYLFGIICWIIDYIIIRRLNIDFIDIIKTSLKLINEIDLSHLDTDMFEEIINGIDFHKVRYTRTFFFALSLLLLEDIDAVTEILDKLAINKEINNNQYLYRQIIDVYKDITVQEKNALNILDREFEEKINKIIPIINTKIQSVNEERNMVISQTQIKPEIIEKERLDIERELRLFINDNIKNKENYIEDTIRFTTLFPRRYLIGDTSHIFIRGNIYKTSVLLFFYRKFIKSCSVSRIIKISDIFKEKTRLIAPVYLNEYFYKNSEYNYKMSGIEIDGKYYPIEWIQIDGPIVALDDLKNFIFLPQNPVEIRLDKDVEKEGEIYTECDVIIKFSENKVNKNSGYSLL